MTLETFFAKFELFADAPDAVAKLREMVLEWAVIGKLCHTDSTEWHESILEDVIELISGQHLLGHEHNAEGRGIPYLTGPSDFGEKNPVPTRWTEQPKVTAEPGDILITVKGSGVGKTNVLVDQPTAISRQLMAIRVTGADSEFVHFVLKRAAEHFQSAKTGIAIPGIGRKEVLGLKVVLPPLAEQKRIVAKVDELMALCDQLEEQQQEREGQGRALARASLARFADAPTPGNLNFLFHDSYSLDPADLRKTILTLAVQGKLVAQDPNDEPAENGETGQSMNRDAAGIPDSWSLSLLSELAEEIVDCPHSTPKWTSSGKICVRTSQFSPGFLNLSESRFVSEETFEERIQRLQPKQNDILYSREGGILGIACRVPAQVELCLGQRMMLIRAGTSLSPHYLEMVLNSPHITEIARRQTTGGAAPRVNVSTVKSYPIPFPSLAEQRRIVAKVDELMALVDMLETQLATARTTSEKLMEAIVAELTT